MEQDLNLKYGNGWAIVTGASDGIGLAYVEELSKRGYKVCLIARNESKLKEKIEILQNKLKESTLRYVVFDFNSSYSDDQIDDVKDKIVSTINNEEISILINNVGLYISKNFIEMSNNEIRQMINVNIYSHLFLTKALLPLMQNRNGKSLILVSGSLSGQILQKKLSLYCASKTYLESVFKIIGMENPFVDVTIYEIGFVQTNMASDTKLPIVISPNEAAVQGLKRAGRFDFGTLHWKHQLIKFAYFNIPLVAYFNQEQSDEKMVKEIPKENDKEKLI